MAHQGLIEAPSRRFIRAYLVIWAVAAVGALGYLTTLAWQPEQLAPVPAQPKIVEPDPSLRAATKALAEVDTIRQTVGSLQKNMGDLKDTVEQRGDQDKTLQSRLAALEEKVAALPTGVATTNIAPTVRPKAVEKAPPQKVAPVKAAQQKPAAARIISVTEEPAGSNPAAGSKAPIEKAPIEKAPIEKAPIETGSITQPQIVFGETVVIRASQLFAVQLDVAPSLDVLRLRWNLLVERHGATLATLQPRFVAPRTQGAPYRLLAGPLASAADAKDICSEMRAQLPACSTTDFVGEPL